MSTFSTFGGSSRKPRQVNMSGRKTNPFAAAGAIGSGAGSAFAVAKAQQEREHRHREGEKLRASRVLQRTWRRHVGKKRADEELRKEFDQVENVQPGEDSLKPYDSVAEAYRQLLRLHWFFSTRSVADLNRLQRCMMRRRETRRKFRGNKDAHTVAFPMVPVGSLYADLQKRLLSMLDRATAASIQDNDAWFSKVEAIIKSVALISMRIPRETARNAPEIYSVLARVVRVLPDPLFYGVGSFHVIQRLWRCPVSLRVEEPYAEGEMSKWFGQDTEEDDAEEEQLYTLEFSESPREHGSNTLSADSVKSIKDEDILMPDAHDQRFPLPPQRSLQLQSTSSGKPTNGESSGSAQAGKMGRFPNVSQSFSPVLLAAYQHSMKPLLVLLQRLSMNKDEDAARCTAWFLLQLASILDFEALVASLKPMAASTNFLGLHELEDQGNRVRLTAALIYLQQGYYRQVDVEEADRPYWHYIEVTSSLLASLPSHVNFNALGKDILNEFTEEQLLYLRSDGHLKSFLARMTSSDEDGKAAEVISSHVLSLLKFFPQEADDIRMKLCLQVAKLVSRDGVEGWLPALSWFWQAATSTGLSRAIISEIQAHPHAAVTMLKDTSAKYETSWKIILCFLELYTFMTKVTDDDEFLAGDSGISYKTLPLQDLRQLVKFLVNTGFAMYFYAPEISGIVDRPDVDGLRARFSSIRAGDASSGHSIAQVTVGGRSIDYFKQVVSGLLRMLYQRDSRRRFLEDGFWLMTGYLDMNGFIDAVVQEEERRREAALDSESEDEQEEAAPFAHPWVVFPTPTARRSRVRSEGRALVHSYVANVAPRLEILRHLPFMIMFPIRLKIFRQFVYLDKYKRRSGAVEADIWRMSMMSRSGEEGVKRHHAVIQRGHEIQDSMATFWDLGEGLKEPIQITFLDQYGNEEIGIDGGGITKEFLMAVTKQALTGLIEINGVYTQLFVANEQQFLYPNPTAIEEMRLGRNAREDQERVSLLLKYFEFLGRIIGKCLYEGILIDALFAGFFALKWAGDFRADLNSLRDLDEELYRNMLQLKNYDGDVEDLGLTFSIVDRVPDRRAGMDTDRRTIVRELVPNGSNMVVTKNNRLVYINRVAQYRLVSQTKLQTDAFLSGLTAMIQPSWLSMFNQGELQALIGGDAVPVDLSDLRRNTQYGGIYQIGTDGLEHPTIRLFWRVLESLTEEEKRGVLKFVTSTPRAPLLGFGSLNPKFSIRDAGSDEERLPTASTCVNLLKLPAYKDERRLREKLLTAITSGAGFDLS